MFQPSTAATAFSEYADEPAPEPAALAAEILAKTDSTNKRHRRKKPAAAANASGLKTAPWGALASALGSTLGMTLSAAFSKRWVLRAFTQMPHGRLTLTLPDGSTHVGGNTSDGDVEPVGFDAVQASIHVVDENDFFTSLLLYSHIGFAEAYMRGAWETPHLAEVIRWFIVNLDHAPMLEGSPAQKFMFNLLGQCNRMQHWLRENSITRARNNIQAHYDLSNPFFSLFLDPTLAYSSARFSEPGMSLEAAQQSKYQALVQKLRLKATDHVLEIGSGWGGFALYAAQQTGCRVTTITISDKQYAEAKRRIEQAGLSDRVEVRLQDYRHVKGQFDKIVSVEMIEAVGDRYYETFFAQCHRLLKPEGLLVLQMITCPDCRFEILRRNVDFIQKHIFPGSLLPSLARITQALNRTGDLFLFELEDLGLSYAKTLAEWHCRFNQHLPEVRALGFDEPFIRKWNYYLQYCQAAFDTRNITVVQAVYTRPNNPGLREAWFSSAPISSSACNIPPARSNRQP
ncbi:MAG: cyclopropane-fatty-acyl-phospholipid synthase family protein [Candidatus Melainabacteria bacterium]|nr:cyclopropane-fatty-acyl-phospholipid synthase family protein [Candidatus Melainabacteria bacterium]